MTISETVFERLIAFTAENEGYTPVPKVDAGGKLVWGHGHNQQPGEVAPRFISEWDSDALLRQDYRTRYIPEIEAAIPAGTTLNDSQTIAIYDLGYNAGPGAVTDVLSAGVDAAPFRMYHVNSDGSQHGWIFGHIDGVKQVIPGLVNRRKREIAMFTSPNPAI